MKDDKWFLQVAKVDCKKIVEIVISVCIDFKTVYYTK